MQPLLINFFFHTFIYSFNYSFVGHNYTGVFNLAEASKTEALKIDSSTEALQIVHPVSFPR